MKPLQTESITATLLSRARIALLITLLVSGCRGSPHEPADMAVVEGNTARFNGLEATLAVYNFSWFPRDDAPLPAPGTVFVTASIEVRNVSDEIQSFDVTEFVWRTLLPGRPGEGPTWDPYPAGRQPNLPSRTLSPGEATAGWLTFQIPRAEYADELVWRPRSDVTLSIDIPLSLATPRHETHALLFGRITDPDRNPVEDARVELTLVVDYEGGWEVGDCRGPVYGPVGVDTDLSGWYEAPFVLVSLGYELCIDARVFAPADSRLGDVRTVATMRAAQPAPDREAPELRIDAVLPSTD